MWRGARPALNLILAVDVDGVLLDPDRGGLGPWGNVLQEQLGIDRAALRDAFFVPCWQDIVIGRRPIEPALEQALEPGPTRVSSSPSPPIRSIAASSTCGNGSVHSCPSPP